VFPGPGALVQVALFIAGLAWCVFVIRRLPADVAELGRTFRQYRASKDPHVLGSIKDTRGRRERFQRDAAREFWTTLAVQVLFFWPVTILVLVAVLWFAYGIVSRIASAF